MNFSSDSLQIDVIAETERIVNAIRDTVHNLFHRKGAVVGISGGIDSSVVLALCVRALDKDKVMGILLPERESSPESIFFAQRLAEKFCVQTVTEDITMALEGFGCYRRRDEAILNLFPEYKPGWGIKIVLPKGLLDESTLNFFRLVVTDLNGNEYIKRLPLKEYYQIVASSNIKQRTRMSMLYYHAELRDYAVIGTANKNEHDLGFFVKYGDGAMDMNPIGHLFKTQIFQLAKYLGVPSEIQSRTPTTDTYPGGSTQEEFFYRISFDLLDSIWLGYERHIDNSFIAEALGLTKGQVDRVVEDINRKKMTTAYLRAPIVNVRRNNDIQD
jgi:NAD+ synthase